MMENDHPFKVGDTVTLHVDGNTVLVRIVGIGEGGLLDFEMVDPPTLIYPVDASPTVNPGFAVLFIIKGPVIVSPAFSTQISPAPAATKPSPVRALAGVTGL